MSVFITFEGGDGSGKSTQAKLLCEYLESNGYDIFMTHEPGGTSYGELFRHLLLDVKSKDFELDARAQVLGFCSARAQLVSEQIIPRLNKSNTITISDRYADSTIAYQVYGGEILDLKNDVEMILKFATHNVKPNLTVYLDISPEEGKRRIEGRVKKEEEPHAFGEAQQLSFLENNHFDQKKLKFHQAVRDGYASLIESEPDRWWVLDANQPIEIIQNEIQNRMLIWLDQNNISVKTQRTKKQEKASNNSNEQISLPVNSFEEK
ncbi:MAG: dTMP kinase [Chloroflexi bacterium]|nr:dTMP kinase [Chloroflexota bacterium]